MLFIIFLEPQPPSIDSRSCGMIPLVMMEFLMPPVESLSPVSIVQQDIPRSVEFRRSVDKEAQAKRYVLVGFDLRWSWNTDRVNFLVVGGGRGVGGWGNREMMDSEDLLTTTADLPPTPPPPHLLRLRILRTGFNVLKQKRIDYV